MLTSVIGCMPCTGTPSAAERLPSGIVVSMVCRPSAEERSVVRTVASTIRLAAVTSRLMSSGETPSTRRARLSRKLVSLNVSMVASIVVTTVSTCAT